MARYHNDGRHISFDERIEVWEKREELHAALRETLEQVSCHKRDIGKLMSADQKIGMGAQRALLNETTGYAKHHIWRMLSQKKPLTQPFAKRMIAALCEQADEDLFALREACHRQMTLIDRLHDLKEMARDNRLFSAKRFPYAEGSIADERRAHSAGYTARKWAKLRTMRGAV